MNHTIKRAELLSPAGNFEKMKAAFLYGADAVYLAGNRFGMRSAADNFTMEELYQAVEYAHERGKKVYLTVNTMPHGDEYSALREYLLAIAGAGLDAMIVADLGVLALVKELLPDMEIHVSTQAGIVSAATAKAFVALGAKRVVLARELTLPEIAAIRAELPPEIEIEAFVHGSMCVSYSGRCMLSQMLTGRDGNRGACTQPCRWSYHLIEEKRPDTPIPIEETDLGTFILSSKDMNTLSILPELLRAGIDSFKIEGRMKSAYYTAVVTNAYRIAMDKYCDNPADYETDNALLRELDSVSHREYCTGYYLDSPFDETQLCSKDGYIREKAYFAIAEEEQNREHEGLYRFRQKNKIKLGDDAELLSPGKTGRAFTVEALYDEQGAPIDTAPHPSQIFYCKLPFAAKSGDILRQG